MKTFLISFATFNRNEFGVYYLAEIATDTIRACSQPEVVKKFKDSHKPTICTTYKILAMTELDPLTKIE